MILYVEKPQSRKKTLAMIGKIRSQYNYGQSDYVNKMDYCYFQNKPTDFSSSNLTFCRLSRHATEISIPECIVSPKENGARNMDYEPF